MARGEIPLCPGVCHCFPSFPCGEEAKVREEGELKCSKEERRCFPVCKRLEVLQHKGEHRVLGFLIVEEVEEEL